MERVEVRKQRRRSRPGTDLRGSQPLLLRGGCASRGQARSLPLRARWQDAPTIRVWGWPCRSRFSRCRCGAPACDSPTGAGSGDAHDESRAPVLPPADPLRHKPGRAGWSQIVGLGVLAPRYQGAAGIFCRESCWSGIALGLQWSQRRTSLVSTLTRVVAIVWLRSARAWFRGAYLHRDTCYFLGNEP